MSFSELDLPRPFLDALAARGYDAPTPVQEAVLAAEPAGADLLVSSRTGSGKTIAFGLALSREILGAKGDRPAALVVAPTRELALQVQRELGWLTAQAGTRVVACVGGMDPRREQRQLAQGAHVVVGTPGRLCDHLDRGSLDLSGLQAVVLDEADEMLDMGFREELERILGAAPSERRTLLFSATLPKGIEELARRYQRDAVRIAATAMNEAHQDIEYIAHAIAPREREHAVVNVLRYHDAHRSLVFAGTRDGVNHLHANLAERGFAAVALSGELTQAERNRALQALRDGRARVLVATDVAARGLDLPEVGLVIHADLPVDSAVMQHRSGRTGRAGRKGVAVVLAPANKRRVAERLLSGAKVQPKWTPVPDADSIAGRDREALVRDLGALSAAETSEDEIELAKELIAAHGAEALVAALIRAEKGKFPAPEELPLTAELAQRAAKGPKRFGDAAAFGAAHARDFGARPGRGFAAGAGPRDADGPPTTGQRAAARMGRNPEGIWFRVNVGRQANADPRWLLPLICRRGRIGKEVIGRIEIGQRETRFEIAPQAAAHFDHWARQPDRKDPTILFAPA